MIMAVVMEFSKLIGNGTKPLKLPVQSTCNWAWREICCDHHYLLNLQFAMTRLVVHHYSTSISSSTLYDKIR